MSLVDFISNAEIGKIKIDFPSSCNANCVGCYTHASERDPDKRLSVEEVKKVLDDAVDLGVKQLAIAGDGEPLIDLDYFFDVVEYAKSKGVEAIVYTNGSLITPEVASRLYDLDISLFVKRNSMDHAKQDSLMRENLSEQAMQGVHNLVEAGFGYERLALESFVSKENEKDLDDVLRYCRENDIMPYFEEFIREGQTQEVLERMELSTEQLLAAFRRYQQIDRDEFGIETKIVPGSRRYGIAGCSLKRLMSVDTSGDVKKCILNVSYGNIKNESLKDVYKRIPDGCNGCSASVLKKS